MMGKYVGEDKREFFNRKYSAFRRGSGPYKLNRFVTIDNRPHLPHNPWSDNDHYIIL